MRSRRSTTFLIAALAATLLLAACGGGDPIDISGSIPAPPLPGEAVVVLPPEPLDRAAASALTLDLQPTAAPLAPARDFGAVSVSDNLAFDPLDSALSILERDSGLLTDSGWIVESALSSDDTALLSLARDPATDPSLLAGRTFRVAQLLQIFATTEGARSVMDALLAFTDEEFARFVADWIGVDSFEPGSGLGGIVPEPARATTITNVNVDLAGLAGVAAFAYFQRGPIFLISLAYTLMPEDGLPAPDVDALQALAQQIDARIPATP